MVPIAAIEMANQAKIDPKVLRQALREENFDWHKPDDRWTVELGSDHHMAMLVSSVHFQTETLPIFPT
jgi:hypothetical protein